ncbi:hypothetical protein [Streptomyces sp. NPDC051567]|uniref:hypothetical protein n=1 Tax=Streptomyces sp. NPDC051567 TaxID=3365660 RepID=UPI003794A94E
MIRDSDPGLNAGKGKALYPLLVTFADVGSRDTDKGYPYRAALSAALDCTKQTVDNATKYLEHEVGLIRVTRRKVDGKSDENDANLYEVFDAWLVHGFEPPADTPPQLVARYGPTLSGFDIEGWMAEHAPAFDLAAWRAAYEARLLGQEAKREEQRRKDRERRKPKKKGGGGISSATPEGEAMPGGGGTDSATLGGTDSATGGGTDSARSTASVPDAPSTAKDGVADAVGKGAGGYACAGGSEGAAGETGGAGSGSAASATDLPPQRTTSPRPATMKTRSRRTPPGFEMVRAAIPAAVAKPGTALYPGLHRAINDLLAGTGGVPRRTPDQVIARINRRWYGEHAETRAAADYRGCDRCTASGCNAPRHSHKNPEGCDRIKNRCAWLSAALLAQDCPDPGCEDGLIIGGQECRACIKRADDRRQDEEAAATASADFIMGNGSVDQAAREAAMTTLEGWSEAATTEEVRFQLLLTGRGIFGALLEHQVREHMTAWQDRHPAPTVPATPRPTPPPEPVTEEEPAYDSPGEEEPSEDASAWEVASRPSAEWLAWKAQAAAERERKAAERLAGLAR